MSSSTHNVIQYYIYIYIPLSLRLTLCDLWCCGAVVHWEQGPVLRDTGQRCAACLGGTWIVAQHKDTAN